MDAGSAWWPAHGPPSHDMHVQVGHRFPSVATIIDDETIALFFQTELFGDLRGLEQQMPEHLVIFRLCFRNTGDWFSRHDQNVHGRAGLDVLECYHLVVLINDLSADFPVSDTFEQCLSHIEEL